jgi:hypothetical protein
MSLLPGRIPLLVALGLVVSGCVNPALRPAPSLPPAQMPPDSVGMDVIFIRFPLGDAELNGKLWADVDEQHFPAQLRRELARNGFRVGVIGNEVPPPLAKLLELADKPPPRDAMQEARPADMEDANHPIGRHLQMRAGGRNEIIASGVYEQMPLLVREGGELHGQTYSQAQGIFAAKAFPQSDSRVRVELVPELHHDQPRRRFVGDQGMMRLETSRPRRVFDDLAISAVLSPGTMLILTALPDRPGSLGHYFFTEGEDNHLKQKLLVLRLCQTQHDDLIAPPPLDVDVDAHEK